MLFMFRDFHANDEMHHTRDDLIPRVSVIHQATSRDWRASKQRVVVKEFLTFLL